jgi:hypothetical protein
MWRWRTGILRRGWRWRSSWLDVMGLLLLLW